MVVLGKHGGLTSIFGLKGRGAVLSFVAGPIAERVLCGSEINPQGSEVDFQEARKCALASITARRRVAERWRRPPGTARKTKDEAFAEAAEERRGPGKPGPSCCLWTAATSEELRCRLINRAVAAPQGYSSWRLRALHGAVCICRSRSQSYNGRPPGARSDVIPRSSACRTPMDRLSQIDSPLRSWLSELQRSNCGFIRCRLRPLWLLRRVSSARPARCVHRVRQAPDPDSSTA